MKLIKCKVTALSEQHAAVEAWHWTGDEWKKVDIDDREHRDALVCIMCGHWLRLGRANDAPPEVQIEIRAAEVVRDYRAMGLIIACPDALLTSPSGQLAKAIWEHEHGAEPPSPGETVLGAYLTRSFVESR